MIAIYVSIVLVLFLIIRGDRRKNEEVPNSKYFYMSDGMSKSMYEKLKSDGISDQRIQEFISREDALLKLEYQSVCSRTSRNIEAAAISQSIIDMFPGYDFSYHQKHLKQISQPTKRINNKILCQY